MWHSYLLQNQKNGWLNQQSPMENYNLILNQDILYRYLLQNSERLRQSCFNPIVVIEKKQTSDFDTIKLQEASKACTFSQKSQNNFKTKKSPKLDTKKKVVKKQNEKFKKYEKSGNQEQLKSKNPGRNSTSNIFRVFLKLCSKGKLEEVIQRKFEKMAQQQNIQISFEYFKLRLKQISPSTSNYVNMNEFKNIWLEQTQFSKAFRSLFHWFSSSFAINHSLTLKGKHKMMKQSILHFLSNLHNIEDYLCEVEREEEEDEVDEKQKRGDQESSKNSPTS